MQFVIVQFLLVIATWVLMILSWSNLLNRTPGAGFNETMAGLIPIAFIVLPFWILRRLYLEFGRRSERDFWFRIGVAASGSVILPVLLLLAHLSWVLFQLFREGRLSN